MCETGAWRAPCRGLEKGWEALGHSSRIQILSTAFKTKWWFSEKPVKTPFLEVRCYVWCTKSALLTSFYNQTAPRRFSARNPLCSHPAQLSLTAAVAFFPHTRAFPGFYPSLVLKDWAVLNTSFFHKSYAKLSTNCFHFFSLYDIFQTLDAPDLVPVSRLSFKHREKTKTLFLDATGSAASPRGGTAPSAKRFFCHRNMTNSYQHNLIYNKISAHISLTTQSYTDKMEERPNLWRLLNIF